MAKVEIDTLDYSYKVSHILSLRGCWDKAERLFKVFEIELNRLGFL